MGKLVYEKGLIATDKATAAKSIRQRVLAIQGLSCECPELDKTLDNEYTNGHKNGHRYHIRVIADGAKASDVKRLYDGLKNRVPLINFSGFTYKNGK